MSRTGLLLRIDGSTERLELDPNPLKVMYDKIECQYVTMVPLTPFMHLWLDEEGLLHDPVANKFATAIVQASTQDPLAQELYGHVVFTGGADAKGNTQGLSDDQVITIERWVDKIRPLLGEQ